MVAEISFSDDDLVIVDDFDSTAPEIQPQTPVSMNSIDSTSEPQTTSATGARGGKLAESQHLDGTKLPIRSENVSAPPEDPSMPQRQKDDVCSEPELEADPRAESPASGCEDTKAGSSAQSNDSGRTKSSNSIGSSTLHCQHQAKTPDANLLMPSPPPGPPPGPPPPPALPWPMHNFPSGPPGFPPQNLIPLGCTPKKGKSTKRCPPPPPPPPILAPPPPPHPPPPFTLLVTSYAGLIPAAYRNNYHSQVHSDELFRTTFNRDIYTTYHAAGLYDLDKHSAILRAADPETWYQYPSTADNAYMCTLLDAGQLEDAGEYLSTEVHGRRISPLVSVTPQIWASAALTAPLDDSVPCTNSAHARASYGDGCPKCTLAATKKLRDTALVYCLVLTTYHDSSSFPHTPGHNPMDKVFKVVKFGNRESAAAEAYYAAGKEGWSTAFSCVMRAKAQGAYARGACVIRVDKLRELADEDAEEVAGLKVRVFF